MTRSWLAALEGQAGTTLWRLMADGAISPQSDGEPDMVIGDTHPAQAFPAPLRPDGPMGPLTQATPHDHLPAEARLLTLGAVAALPNWDGVVLTILPGSAHWTHVSAGEAISTLGTATPRLARALNAQGPADPAAVADTLARPERLAAALFSRSDAAASYLVGADLAAAKRWWLGQEIRMIGAGPLADMFADALAAQGAPLTRVDPQVALAQGLATLIAS